MKRYPGFIDIGTDIPKGSWRTTSSIAVQSGYTSLIAAPASNEAFSENTQIRQALDEPLHDSACDFAMLTMVTPENIRSIGEWADEVPAVLVDFSDFESAGSFARMNMLSRLFNRWPAEKPICVRGNENQIGSAVFMAQVHSRKVHICSVATRREIEMIDEAKNEGVSVTCDIHPLSLLISSETSNAPDSLKKTGTEDDRQALWQYLKDIDCFSSAGYKSRNGSAAEGLRVMLPLLLSMKKSEMLSDQDILLRCCVNPAKIFGISLDPATAIEFDETPDGNPPGIKAVRLHGQLVYSADDPQTGDMIRGKRIRGYSA